MSEKKKIIIAQDHTILREGLKMLLSSNPELAVVGEAQSGAEAVRSVKSHPPDLILMDIAMPKQDGTRAIREIKRLSPSTKVLVLTVHKTEDHILGALRSGADGYILKEATYEELAVAIEDLFAGKSYISPSISGKVIEGYLEGRRNVKSSSSWEALTQRERQVLKMVAKGNRNKEIAGNLAISVKTVEKHRANLMRKLDLHSASSLTAFAIEKRLTVK
ncbi:MAG: response regulator transcription factor [Syntrophobacteraceae bacterium]|nr:response regulator transcription factor [Syntrophobacteraceae bacterium]